MDNFTKRNIKLLFRKKKFNQLQLTTLVSCKLWCVLWISHKLTTTWLLACHFFFEKKNITPERVYVCVESKTLFHPYKPTGTLDTSSFPSNISPKPFLAAYLLCPSLVRCRFRLSLRIFSAAAAVSVSPLVPPAKRCVLQLRPIISLVRLCPFFLSSSSAEKY